MKVCLKEYWCGLTQRNAVASCGRIIFKLSFFDSWKQERYKKIATHPSCQYTVTFIQD